MGFHSVVSCNETAVTYDGALVYLIVSDSPDPDENDRDEFGVMGNHFMMSCVETTMMCDGFFDVFCCGSSLYLQL